MVWAQLWQVQKVKGLAKRENGYSALCWNSNPERGSQGSIFGLLSESDHTKPRMTINSYNSSEKVRGKRTIPSQCSIQDNYVYLHEDPKKNMNRKI